MITIGNLTIEIILPFTKLDKDRIDFRTNEYLPFYFILTKHDMIFEITFWFIFYFDILYLNRKKNYDYFHFSLSTFIFGETRTIVDNKNNNKQTFLRTITLEEGDVEILVDLSYYKTIHNRRIFSFLDKKFRVVVINNMNGIHYPINKENVNSQEMNILPYFNRNDKIIYNIRKYKGPESFVEQTITDLESEIKKERPKHWLPFSERKRIMRLKKFKKILY